jgi:hypothetical protein
MALSYSEMNVALDFYSGGICQLLMERAGSSPEQDQQLSQQLGRILRGQIQLLP